MNNNCSFVNSIFVGDLQRLPNGVFSPGFEHEEVDRYIHDLFNTEDGAKSYAARYRQREFFHLQLKRAIVDGGVVAAAAPLILDIGSGSGNTVFPSLDLFPNSRVIATDLSVPLLGILADSDKTGRVCCVQQNAEDLNFVEQTFDLVIGGAILHHLFHPDKTIASALRVLKPGGVSVFFEPCQNGQVFLKMAYERITQDKRFRGLGRDLQKAVKRQIQFLDLRLRCQADQNPDVYAQCEDKWLFSRDYLRKAAKTGGAREVNFLPMDSPQSPIETKVGVYFRALRMETPDWVKASVREFDESFPRSFLVDNPTAVALVCRK